MIADLTTLPATAPLPPVIARPAWSDRDLDELGALPAEVRGEVEAWLEHLCSVTRRGIGQQITAIARAMGCGASTARRHFDALRRQGDWRVLINRSKCPQESERGHTEEFREWYRALVESNQRKAKPAYREFLRRWRAGETIPGLNNALPRHSVPPGCTYSNLQYACRSTRAELAAMRQGLVAAGPYLAKTFSTRAGLWPASHYMFDDVWHDNFVVFRNRPVRVLEFDCIEVLSACKVAWGTQPRVEREDGTFEGLKEKQMRMLLARLLFQEGFSPRGTELMAEHGTAAVPEWLERLLFDRTGGLIRTRRSGIDGVEQAVAGMFTGRGKGNPKFKAPLESLRNLIHNELGALPAQTGRNVEERPESLHGELTYTTDILKARELLPPSAQLLFRLPLWDYHAHFLPQLQAVYQAINDRDWHALEGWSECGFVAIEYRLSPDTGDYIGPAQFLTLPAETQAIVTQLAQKDARFWRRRQLRPSEVWRAGRQTLRQIPAFVVAEILGSDFAREEKVNGAYFEFSDNELSTSVLRYESRVVDSQGNETELQDGGKWLLTVNPFDLEQVFVSDAKGAFVGIAKRDRRVSRADVDALREQWGRVAKRDKDILTPLRKRHAQTTREAIALREHNQQVISDCADAVADSDQETRAALRAAMK